MVVAAALTLFLTGLTGIACNRKNVLIILIGVELAMLGVNLFIFMNGVIIDDAGGQSCAIWVVMIAAAESAVGLAILVVYFRVRGSIGVITINLLRG